MKKGIVASQAISLILAVLAIVTIWFLIQNFIEESPEASQIQACRASNMAASYIEQETWFPAPRGTCQTIDASDSPNIDLSSEEGVKEGVAEMASRCWYMFGEGQIDNIFRKEGWFGAGGGQGCHTCYEFSTPEDIQKINASSMYGYLTTTDYQASPFIRRTTDGLLGDGMSDLALQDEPIDEEITVDVLQARNVDSFVDDFAGVLTSQQKTTIQSSLAQLITSTGPEMKQANPYVLITPNTDDISRSSSHSIVDELGIDRDGVNNALFIWVDIGSNTARIDYGGDLATHIQEDDLSDLLQEFKGDSVRRSLPVVVERLKGKLEFDYDDPPEFILENPNSYLSYLSGPGSAPLISDLEPNRRYSVVYMDASDRSDFQNIITGAVTGAATGAVAGSFVPGIGNVAGGVAGLIVGAAGGVAAKEQIDSVRSAGGDFKSWITGEEKVVEKSIVVGSTDTLYRECNT